MAKMDTKALQSYYLQGYTDVELSKALNRGVSNVAKYRKRLGEPWSSLWIIKDRATGSLTGFTSRARAIKAMGGNTSLTFVEASHRHNYATYQARVQGSNLVLYFDYGLNCWKNSEGEVHRIIFEEGATKPDILSKGDSEVGSEVELNNGVIVLPKGVAKELENAKRISDRLDLALSSLLGSGIYRMENTIAYINNNTSTNIELIVKAWNHGFTAKKEKYSVIYVPATNRQFIFIKPKNSSDKYLEVVPVIQYLEAIGIDKDYYKFTDEEIKKYNLTTIISDRDVDFG